MNFTKYIERIRYLDELIRKEKTGNPEELANRLGISRAQLYNILEFLKAEGLTIGYTRKRSTFYYTCGKKLEVNFSIKVVSDEEARAIGGGNIAFGPVLIDGRNIALQPGIW